MKVVTKNTNHTSSDDNRFRPNPGADAPFRWNASPMNAAVDPEGPVLRPQLEIREFATLAEYSKTTGQDARSVLADFDIFVPVPKLDATNASSLQKLYKAADLDFGLWAGTRTTAWSCPPSPTGFPEPRRIWALWNSERRLPTAGRVNRRFP